MSGVQHISMRVPWRDEPWHDRLCASPLDNSSCLLLQNIGEKRDDLWEVANAGKSFVELADLNRLPCLSERGTFMSAHGYSLEKEHPYRFNKSLSGHLLPTVVSVPPYSFEAVPFRWLSRETVDSELWAEADGYNPQREDHAHKVLDFKPGWLMDAENQRALIDRFFAGVTPGESLVLIYLKHSPFQEQSTRRLLVGAAVVTSVTAPPRWNQSGNQPFDSSMWETIVGHSLRPDQRDGLLLPYQQLIPSLEAGEDVSDALAWAPEGADIEFSYVTEHVSDDVVIAALSSLRAAVDGFNKLGVSLPRSASEWIDRQIERVWHLRGPVPGLAAVLGHLGLESAHRVVRRIRVEPGFETDPWGVVERVLDPSSSLGQDAGASVPRSVGLTWRALEEHERAAYQVLSAMDVDREQVAALMDGQTTLPVSPEELVDNPYFAANCSYRSRHPIPLATVDQACFPAAHVRWANLVSTICGLDDPGDARRVEALIVQVLEKAAEAGDTVVGQDDVVHAASQIPLARPCAISRALLTAHRLDAESLDDYPLWTPLVSAELEGGAPAYKLLHLHDVRVDLRQQLMERRDARRHNVPFDAKEAIDREFGALDPGDHEELLARAEKAAGLAELFASRLSVLVGPAGTGKTTLLRTLVSVPEIQQDGVLLLAPTGKARVQLQSKVGAQAHTLASFLVKKGGYDPDTGRYMVVDPSKRSKAGLVVIDEASMLTEEMLASTLSALEGVKRLVLVGDHRQLPPIGPGRPFVDAVEWLRPDHFSGPTRVGPGYVELTVFRRQKGLVGERADLALARWFGGEDLPVGGDDIWQQLRLGIESETLSYRSWGSAGVIAALIEAIESELGLGQAEDVERAFKLTYGGRLSDDGRYVNWPTGPGGAGEGCESWQILSPTRSRVFGTVEVNRLIKLRYRSGDLAWAEKHYGYRPPKPLGPERITIGDKVMQTRNDGRAKAFPAGAGMDYVANGEIGVVVGRASPKPNFANVEFSSQTGATYGYWPGPSDDPPLELAWAVTVHKSQGSEFGVTFLVLPARVAISRELLYTALTRQTKKVVILHEGTVEDLFALTSASTSETARRMTDLFRTPAPRELAFGDGMRRFDGNLIHVAPGGVMVRSKNEVIVATILESVAAGRWSYERPLSLNGVTKYPDFTIETASGDTVIWEHLGMMANPRYEADWLAKKAWYTAQGFRPFDEPKAVGERGVLLWTDDRAGVDQPAWEAMARKVLGDGVVRRPAKKTVSRPPNPR